MQKVKELVTAFITYYDNEFNPLMAAPLSVAKIVLDQGDIDFHKGSQNDREIFRNFNELHSTTKLQKSQCQCTLLDQAHQCIKEIQV